MNKWSVVAIVLVGCLFSGCAVLEPSLPDQLETEVIVQPSDADMILSCLAEREDLTRNEMRAKYDVIEGQISGKDNEDDKILDLICLSLHRQASYQQFKDGMEYLAARIDIYPNQAPALQGIFILAQRIDREKISRWTLANRHLDEKEGLEAENKELLEHNQLLQANALQDQARITELQKQIEQLKDIENILKSRER
jgi:hypothetical protein